MEVKRAIEKRKAIRKWQKRAVPNAVVTELFEAARWAPSAKNVQSHRYFILKGEEILCLEKAGVFKQPFVCEAPLVIVCCADPSQYPASADVDQSPEEYALIDLSIATAFLTLRATELGLGTVYVAWIYRDKLKKALKIPTHIIVPYVLPIGYPAENPPRKPRKKIDEIIINDLVL